MAIGTAARCRRSLRRKGSSQSSASVAPARWMACSGSPATGGTEVDLPGVPVGVSAIHCGRFLGGQKGNYKEEQTAGDSTGLVQPTVALRLRALRLPRALDPGRAPLKATLGVRRQSHGETYSLKLSGRCSLSTSPPVNSTINRLVSAVTCLFPFWIIQASVHKPSAGSPWSTRWRTSAISLGVK